MVCKYWGTFEPEDHSWLRLTEHGHVSRQGVPGYLCNAQKMLRGDFRQLSLAR